MTVQSEKGTQPSSLRIKAVTSTANAWIASADSKAFGILGLCGVLIGLAIVRGPISKTALRLHLAFLACSILAATASLVSLWPRLERTKILCTREAGSPLPASPTFFGDVGKMSFHEFLTTIDELNAELLERDLYEQAYILAVIARRKMLWVKVSAGLLMLAVLAMAVLSVVISRSGA
ncbi:MAG: hypothetical protein GX977_02070 [Firmicutes bacterium]|nr:hypothetical protein [Bacillota bacterium]